MSKRLKRIYVIFLATILTFSSSIAAFASTAKGWDDVGTYNYYWEIGTEWPNNTEYCYAEFEDSWEEDIVITGIGYSCVGEYWFNNSANSSYGLVAGHYSPYGFTGVKATYDVWSYDGSTSNTYEVYN